jgi:hypothetical protein
MQTHAWFRDVMINRALGAAPNQCMGCQAGWEFDSEIPRAPYGSHRAPDGGLVWCERARYVPIEPGAKI